MSQQKRLAASRSRVDMLNRGSFEPLSSSMNSMSGFTKDFNKAFYNLGSRLIPNFESNDYRQMAKSVFIRRKSYNPRESASKSRDRLHISRQRMQKNQIDFN